MKIYIESKDAIIERTADDRGRITLGSEYADADVQVAILGANTDSEGIK